MPKPRNDSKPPAGKKGSPQPQFRPPAPEARKLPVEELEKASRQKSENGRKAPQKDL